MMNVVIWARVSSREQREGYSIDAQLRLARQKAQREGWTIIREFAVAESARKSVDRKAFQDFLAWVQKNARKIPLHAIVSHKLDRICRNMRDAVRMQELEDLYGVKLRFVDNEFGPGAAGILSFNVMAAVAQYYSDNLRSEVQKGILEKVQQGWAPGLAPYGYCNDGKDKQEPIKIHPERSKTVLRIFELYARGTYTFKSLADQLQREGHIYLDCYPRFHRTALSYILKNRFYIGEVRYRGQTFLGKHRLFVPKEWFDRCQELLEGKNRRVSYPRLELAGGFFRCAFCGAAMTGEKILRKQKDGSVREHIYYRCANNNPPADHPRIRWRLQDLDSALLAEIKKLTFPNDQFRIAFQETLQAALDDANAYIAQQHQTLKKRLTEIQTFKERLLSGFLDGTIDQPTYQRKNTDLAIEEKNIQQKLQDLTNQQNNALTPQQIMKLFELSQRLEKIWNQCDWQQKRSVLELISSNRIISDTTVRLINTKPFDALKEIAELKISRRDRI